MPVETLSDTPLDQTSPLSTDFRERDCATFRDAARFVRDLRYGRNSRAPAYSSVLRDGCGTCSSKHALIAALAMEVGANVTLMLGIYEMDEENTPGVGSVLAEAGLHSIPEAHCWISYKSTPTDLTSPNAESQFAKRTFIYREAIQPDQIGNYKATMHREFLSRWVGKNSNLDLDADAAWAVRERCIAALSK